MPTIDAIGSQYDALVHIMARIFNKYPGAYKDKSALSDALGDVANLVVGDKVSYQKLNEMTAVFEKNDDRLPEFKELRLYLLENQLEFVNFEHQKPQNYISHVKLIEANRLAGATVNDNISLSGIS